MEDPSEPSPPPSSQDKTRHLKQPRGLMTLTLSESWIAFSLYGFGSLLVLYTAGYILQPEIAPRVFGLETFSVLLKWIFAAKSQTALATGLTSAYMMGIFLWPIAAGIIADFFLGFKRAFLIGMILTCAGFACLAFDETFLFALLFLILGFGFVRSLLPAQLSQLYDYDDARRADGYQIFCLGLQFTAILSPIAGGYAEKWFGWGAAFAAVGIGIPLTALTYQMGARYLPQSTPRIARKVRSPLSRDDRKALFVIAGFIVALAINSVPNSQLFSAYEIWGGQHYDLFLLGHRLPVATLMSLDGIVSVITGFMIIGYWRVWARRWTMPDEMTKIIIGGFLAALGPLALMIGAFLSPEAHSVSLWWGVVFHTLNDLGFGMAQATGMALVAKLAPESIRTSVISCYPFSSFLSTYLAGRLASCLGAMGSISFWGLHVVASLLGFMMFIAIYLGFRDIFRKTT